MESKDQETERVQPQAAEREEEPGTRSGIVEWLLACPVKDFFVPIEFTDIGEDEARKGD